MYVNNMPTVITFVANNELPENVDWKGDFARVEEVEMSGVWVPLKLQVTRAPPAITSTRF